MVKCLEQPIVNILVRNYNISPSEAHSRWEKAIAKKDDRICEILDNLIKASGDGLPVLINRNKFVFNIWEAYSYIFHILLSI